MQKQFKILGKNILQSKMKQDDFIIYDKPFMNAYAEKMDGTPLNVSIDNNKITLTEPLVEDTLIKIIIGG